MGPRDEPRRRVAGALTGQCYGKQHNTPQALIAGSRSLGGEGSVYLLTRPTFSLNQHVHFIGSSIPEIQADAAVWQLGNLGRN